MNARAPLSIFLSTLLAILATAPVTAQEEPAKEVRFIGIEPLPSLNRFPLQGHVQATSIDGALLQMARQSQLNFLADVTEAPPELVEIDTAVQNN